MWNVKYSFPKCHISLWCDFVIQGQLKSKTCFLLVFICHLWNYSIQMFILVLVCVDGSTRGGVTTVHLQTTLLSLAPKWGCTIVPTIVKILCHCVKILFPLCKCIFNMKYLPQFKVYSVFDLILPDSKCPQLFALILTDINKISQKGRKKYTVLNKFISQRKVWFMPLLNLTNSTDTYPNLFFCNGQYVQSLIEIIFLMLNYKYCCQQ